MKVAESSLLAQLQPACKVQGGEAKLSRSQNSTATSWMKTTDKCVAQAIKIALRATSVADFLTFKDS